MSELEQTPPAPSGVLDHPIGLVVTDDLERRRLTVFFRYLLALPHFVWIYLWGVAAWVVVVIAWVVAIFTGRVPDSLHAFLAAFNRYSTRVYGYALLLADPFPPFSSAGSYPIDLRVEPGVAQSRLTVFFRFLLAIPAFVLASVFWNVSGVLAVLGWFYALATGRMHSGIRDLGAWMLRYEMQTNAYAMLLTGRYPSLSGAPSA